MLCKISGDLKSDSSEPQDILFLKYIPDNLRLHILAEISLSLKLIQKYFTRVNMQVIDFRLTLVQKYSHQ